MENKISMVGIDGKVRWVEESKASDFIDKGWRVITNPKEVYYPNLDQRLREVKPDEIGHGTKVVEDSNHGNTLGIIIL